MDYFRHTIENCSNLLLFFLCVPDSTFCYYGLFVNDLHVGCSDFKSSWVLGRLTQLQHLHEGHCTLKLQLILLKLVDLQDQQRNINLNRPRSTGQCNCKSLKLQNSQGLQSFLGSRGPQNNPLAILNHPFTPNLIETTVQGLKKLATAV